jgi:hypothetical protein
MSNGLIRLSLLVALPCALTAVRGLTTSSTGGLNQAPATRIPTTAYISALYCKKCHNEANESKTDLCRLTEYHDWDSKDRHRIAWKILQEPRAKQIGELLSGPSGKDVSKDARCIVCHAMDTSKIAAARPDDPVTKYSYTLEEGISCVECHGPAKEWVFEHGLPTSQWRGFPRQKKELEYGMFDLWNPATRTKLCLSCHVGDREKGRFVTHEMYAAGHPPLPSIEVATFSDQQPRHWQIVREKDEAIRKVLAFKEGRLEQAELVAVDSLVALKASLELLTGRSDGDQGQPPMLDFAQFDCAACHHDLVQSDRSWRQARGSGHAPGRPLPPYWPRTLVRLGLEAADPARADLWFKELKGKLHKFESAMTERPFGNIEKARTIGAEIIGSLDGPLASLDLKIQNKSGTGREIVGQDAALKMLHSLGKCAAERTPDYESARQLAWAFRTIYLEWSREPNQPNKEILEILDRLDERLFLTLGPGPTGKQTSIAQSQGARLKATASYNPSEFLKDFQTLLANLLQIQQVPPQQPGGGG